MNTIANYDIKKLAIDFGTPLYIYDKSQIEDNYNSLSAAFKKYYPKTRVCYSVKANNNLNILQIIKELGGGLDVSSPIELALSQKAGFNASEIVYTGNYESNEDIRAVFDAKIQINFDDISSFNKYLELGIPEIVSFRINPGIGRGGFEGITTAGADAKFGVPYEKALDVYKIAKEAGAKKFGIHMMTGSNNLEPYHFAETLDKLLMIATNIFAVLGEKLEYIDIGGGFGVPYTNEEEALNIDETARLISEIILEKKKKYDFGNPELIIEPGRYIMANAGYLIANVSAIKNSYKTFVGINAGMNCLVRQAMYGAFHRIEVYGKDALEKISNVCGNICENSDIFAKALFLPDISEDDILIFRDAGAYGYSMASNYNGRLRPAEVLIYAGNAKIIRRRETLEDVLRLY